MLFWFFQGNKLVIDLERMSLDTDTLVFNFLTIEDTGTYYCAMREEKTLTHIDIFTLAVIPEEPHHTVDVGTQVILLCNEFAIKNVFEQYLYPNRTTRISW